MTLFRLMQMTTLAQDTINLVTQFITIVLKILAPHARNRLKPFLYDIEVKRQKTTYNNKELISGIKQYIVEHIEDLDRISADLERARVTIASTNSQFC